MLPRQRITFLFPRPLRRTRSISRPIRLHGRALVYQLAPKQALGFGKGQFSHTRWEF